MNSTIYLNGFTRMAGYLAARQAAAPDGGFSDAVGRLRAGESGTVQAAPPKEDMSLEAYQQTIREKISRLPMSGSSRMQSISIQITDEGFEAMKADPEYEAWVLDRLGQDLLFENPWTSVCGGGYVVHHFGATKEEYHGESWYPGYMGGKGASLFDEKSQGSFWEQRMERHKVYLEQQQEAAVRRRMLMRLRMDGGPVSAAELLMGLL